jgi:hypothetical protein
MAAGKDRHKIKRISIKPLFLLELGFLKLPGILSIVRVTGLFFGVKMRDITLKLDSTRKDKHQITSQGFLVVDANLTRAGGAPFPGRGIQSRVA